ncbi:hypothetical protein N7326_01910 [Corynebacterium sp. ES2794-CONJ1]|uniref:hypothetical protein n=1 Tax=unclassified Corynebacterium TaxID=2624378 RepID=UPI00216747FB|nr:MULTISPECIES: hypothetical protein [unclassified Corynebacterium]MCS4489046.1 hypothetical protein [Corynebacterium sp. ES2775-CONJ]MCS4490859.1 hypothetical protein [Corynebacterium sp. ES2715-CONJ3]MCS4531258.1 hypothetical protein [Corynebacterium sp. ES2730-CONJ]MCU9518627.1 hypothetical protein [Corynebacterium sp. ES2794-CONJ1]
MSHQDAVINHHGDAAVKVTVDLHDGGTSKVHTHLKFFDELLLLFADSARISLKVLVEPDPLGEPQNIIEETGVALGQAIHTAIGRAGDFRSYGHAVVAASRALAEVAMEYPADPVSVVSGEPEPMVTAVVDDHYATMMNEYFFEAFAAGAQMNMHVIARYGSSPREITQAEFKATGAALQSLLMELCT